MTIRAFLEIELRMNGFQIETAVRSPKHACIVGVNRHPVRISRGHDIFDLSPVRYSIQLHIGFGVIGIARDTNDIFSIGRDVRKSTETQTLLLACGFIVKLIFPPFITLYINHILVQDSVLP